MGGRFGTADDTVEDDGAVVDFSDGVPFRPGVACICFPNGK
jgi:hypothetical protein